MNAVVADFAFESTVLKLNEQISLFQHKMWCCCVRGCQKKKIKSKIDDDNNENMKPKWNEQTQNEMEKAWRKVKQQEILFIAFDLLFHFGSF